MSATKIKRPAEMENLRSEEDGKKLVVYPIKSRDFYLPFYKEEIHFVNSKELIRFIKSVEKLIRFSDEYKMYIKHLKEDYGLRRCAIFGNIDDDRAKIEMHHGPIFTLFDYVEITLSWIFKQGMDVDSSTVAHEVLKDHMDELVQVIMLSKMGHNAVHPKNNDVEPEFLDIRSAYGNLVGYLEKYRDVISFSHIQKIRRYFKKYENIVEGGAEQNTIFKTVMSKWVFKGGNA